MPRANIAGNRIAPIPPRVDVQGITARQFLRSMFEFEYCHECGQDEGNHTVVIGPTGGWFAMCKTQVIFRKWPKSEGGDVIALFPNDLGTANLTTCNSFEHVGQHGAASLNLIDRTTLAKPNEYADLKAELESAPYFYHLDVRKRVPLNASEIRRRKLR